MNPRTIQYMSIALFAMLLLWGSYTLLYYLGVPYHGAALLGNAMTELVSPQSCVAGDTLCLLSRGMQTLLPALSHTIIRAEPFLWYAILCLLVYIGFAGRQLVASGGSTVKISWSPWKIVLLAVGCTWLLSTTLSYGSVDGRPVRLYVEPTAQSYNVSPQALEMLREDEQKLLSRGCLSPIGESQTGDRLSMLRTWCIQSAFVTRVLTQALFVLVLLLQFLIAGRAVLGWLRLRAQTPLMEALFSVGLGAGAWIVLLWCLAIAGFYTQGLGWALVLAVPALGHRHARYWLEAFFRRRWAGEYLWYAPVLLIGWLLVSYIALNFLEVVRPFPIGWDDLGSYLNRPRLLVSYGRFIYSMSPFDWTYLTSLGFLLFGYNAPMGSTASMMVNWTAGLLAVLGVFGFARTFLGGKSGMLAALLYYALPLVGHFSFADMKIDNAVFFFGTLATLAMFSAVFPAEDDSHVNDIQKKIRLLFLAGIFGGLAFATKSTAMMVLLALGGALAGITLHWTAFLGGILFAFLLFSWQGVLSVQDVLSRIGSSVHVGNIGTIFTVACLAGIAASVGYAVYKGRSHLKPAVLLITAFGCGFVVSVLPWIEHNNIEFGYLRPRIELSAPNTISPSISVDALQGELAVNREAPACKASGAKEELDRYWGFEQGIGHYLTLPWRTVMNLDSTGYYVTTLPILLLIPLLLLLPYFWSRQGRWLRWLLSATLLMLLQWMFLANGIPWYGVGILLGLVIGIEALTARAPDPQNRIAAGVMIALSLSIAFGMRFWQFEQQRNLFEYSMGKVSADSLRAITIPYYDPITETVVARNQSMPDRPYLYRVGTFIPYFIPKNLNIIGINDHQLDVFNCMYQERDIALTVKRFKALGFNSIIFDTNTATIETDEQGSLHKKVNAFVDFVNNPASGLQIVISDTNAGVAFILIP